MTYALAIVCLALLLGLAPLRRVAFARRAVTFTLPAIAGGLAGMLIGLWLQARLAGVEHLVLLATVLGALGCGIGAKPLLDDFFDNRGQP